MTDDGRRMPSDGKSSHCLWQGELKMINKRLKCSTTSKKMLKYNKIKVCFCPQKCMSPPVPQTVVKGKKAIYNLGNK
jgi:hypothetical protein